MGDLYEVVGVWHSGRLLYARIGDATGTYILNFFLLGSTFRMTSKDDLAMKVE